MQQKCDNAASGWLKINPLEQPDNGFTDQSNVFCND